MAHPEMDDLLDSLITFAQLCLKKRHGFVPFGSSIVADGSLKRDALDYGAMGFVEPDHIDSDVATEAFENLYRDQARAGQIRACGICYDATITPENDKPTRAIACTLAHQNGEAVKIYLPYRKQLLSYRFGDLIAVPWEIDIFEPLS